MFNISAPSVIKSAYAKMPISDIKVAGVSSAGIGTLWADIAVPFLEGLILLATAGYVVWRLVDKIKHGSSQEK